MATSIRLNDEIEQRLDRRLGTFWRYRFGDYRVICDIRDQELIILVVRIGNRRDISQ